MNGLIMGNAIHATMKPREKRPELKWAVCLIGLNALFTLLWYDLCANSGIINSEKESGGTMKQILIFISTALFALSAYSQSLRLSSAGNGNFQLMVDGKAYNSNGYSGEDIVVNNLSGQHNISVYKTNKRGKNRRLYSSNLNLSYGQEIHLTINNDGSISREETSANAAYGDRSAMSSASFDELYRHINNQWGQSSRMSSASDAFNNSAYYFSTGQVRQIVGLINSESNRLELLKLAYDKVTDQDNFYQLQDLLSSQAGRNELDRYVRSKTHDDAYNSYKSAMNDYTFNQLYQNIINQRNTSLKLSEVTRAFNTTANYFNTSQVIQLISLVAGENNRLQLAKLSLDNIVDPENMNRLFDLLSTQSARENLDDYIKRNGFAGSGYNYSTHAAMSEASFNALYDNIRKKWLPYTKYNAAVEAFSSSENYFTTQQVHQIIALLSDETNRLNLAKLAFDNIVDRQNFRQLYDLLDSQTSKDELDNYIRTNYNYQY